MNKLITTQETDPRRISDHLKKVSMQTDVNSRIILMQAITRAIMAVIVVMVGAYLAIAQIPITDTQVTIALFILGAFFGIDAAARFVRRPNGN